MSNPTRILTTLDQNLTNAGWEDDIADICFLLKQEPLTPERLQQGFASARVPDVPEVKELFEKAQPKVLALAASQK